MQVHTRKPEGTRASLVLCLLCLCLCQVVTALYDKASPVKQLTPASLSALRQSDGVSLVEFYAPWCGHCKTLAPEWAKAATALKGLVTVAALDADEHKAAAGEFGVQGFPTIKVLRPGKGSKGEVVDYTGGRTAKDIVDFALKQAAQVARSRLGGSAGSAGSGSKGKQDAGSFYGPSSDVQHLTDDNFKALVTSSEEPWLVEFFAPWCGHCQQLKPVWDKLASSMKGRVGVGAVDCTASQSVCQKYGVQSYPTIKVFRKDKKTPDDFQGGRDLASLQEAAEQLYLASRPPPEVVELTEEGRLQQQCVQGSQRRTCFMAFLPALLDTQAAGRQKLLQMVTSQAEHFRERPFAWLWAEGGQQAALEASLGVGGFGYPALVALHAKDGKYAVMRSAFESSHIREFVAGLGQGKVRVEALNGPLGEVQAVQSWDGKDAEAVEQDEFSLDEL